MSTIIDRRDLSFQLYDVLDVERFTRRPRYADHSRETFDAAIDTAHRIAEDAFQPHNRKADENEPHLVDGKVRIIPEVKAALDAFCGAGLMAAEHDYELGGMQLPWTVGQAVFGLFQGANVATVSYAMLTRGAANVLRVFGTDEQKRTYLLPMLEGRWFGTMVLTEPQAGSSLADIKTAAEPAGDGSYRITGNKIFISAGDHELSENIVHLVLARIKGAPAGTRGISLFLVPKYLPDADGRPGRRNDLALAGLIHKMGWRGTTSTMLNFGENGGATGWLVGEAGQGLATMFHMMNEARIGVGMAATMLGYTGYLHALEYARGRPQGRHADAKDPLGPQVPIIEHADVRRMLLAQKAAAEGALSLCLYAASLVDDQHTHPDEARRRDAGLLLDILTPIVKAWPSEHCLDANRLAIQVHGGYGYTREYPVEQFYRDNRLNLIHEGTNGIQALDLLGRKATLQGGAVFRLLMREIRATLDEARAGPAEDVRGMAEELDAAVALAEATTAGLAPAIGRGEARKALANAALYLDQMGHTVIAWMWLRQAMVAADRQGGDGDFLRGKRQTARYFFTFELPRVRHWASVLQSQDTTTLDMAEDWF